MITACASTVDYIGFHAVHSPTRHAILLNGVGVTYSKFYRDIAKMVASLEELSPQPGHIYAVESPEFYTHCLIVLALDALGVCTLSYVPNEIEAIQDTLAKVEMAICSPDGVADCVVRVHVLDPAWAKRVCEAVPVVPIQPRVADPSAALRLVKSSGTTGQVKAMIHTRAIHEARLHRSQMHLGFGKNSRYLMTMGFSIQASHLEATGCIRAGGMCVYEDRIPLHDALAKYDISEALFLPKVLLQLLDGIPKNYTRRDRLRIMTLGAPVSNPVRKRVADLLGATVLESYGTNESGTICRMRPDSIGTVIPGVQVETVDDDDQPVFDAPGFVRVKSNGCVEAYLDSPDETREKFRDGWFYPGDMAVMRDRRTLLLLGRADDLINVGGVKVSPRTFEDDLVKSLQVDDAALAIVDDDQGKPQYWLAVVPTDGEAVADIAGRAADVLPTKLRSVKLIGVKAIPRTETGKIQRYKLKQTLKHLQEKH